MKGLANAALRGAVGLLARTWRVEARGEEHLTRARHLRTPRVVAMWHQALLPLFWRHRGDGAALLISRHRDGEPLARAAEAWGYRVVRGSSTRGGASALRQLMRVLSARGEVALTPDGPRGPSGRAKPGAVAAAQRANAAIIPVGLAASSCWALGSWGAILLPKPFARLRVIYGEPFRVAPGPAGLRAGTERLTQELDRLTALATCA